MKRSIEVEQWPAKQVLGITASFQGLSSGQGNHLAVIPRLWGRFLSRRGELSREVRGHMVGVSRVSQRNPQLRDYLAGVEWLDREAPEPPTGMEVWNLPPLRVAKVVHRGPVGQLAESLREAMHTWLPAAGLEPSGDFDIERYDHRFKLGVADSELDLFISIL